MEALKNISQLNRVKKRWSTRIRKFRVHLIAEKSLDCGISGPKALCNLSFLRAIGTTTTLTHPSNTLMNSTTIKTRWPRKAPKSRS
jgi:hypothetical protein